MAASLLRCRLIFYLLSVFLHAEVLFQHVDGGDIKLMMRVRPATTPRRHQARGLPSGDHSTVEILRHSPPAAADAEARRDEAGAVRRGRHGAAAHGVASRTP